MEDARSGMGKNPAAAPESNLGPAPRGVQGGGTRFDRLGTNPRLVPRPRISESGRATSERAYRTRLDEAARLSDSPGLSGISWPHEILGPLDQQLPPPRVGGLPLPLRRPRQTQGRATGRGETSG